MSIHPALIFFALALLLPLLARGVGFSAWRWLLPLPAVCAVGLVGQALLAAGGAHGGGTLLGGQFTWLTQTLTTQRIDGLSLVFLNVFAVQAVIGSIYSLHLKDVRQHIAALFYVGGAFVCVLAGDYLTLFVGWEIQSVASTMLIWLNSKDNPDSPGAGMRYFLAHTLGGLLVLGGMLLRHQAIGTFDFTAADPAGMHLYDWLILFGFGVNAAFVVLHAWLPDAYPEATITGAVFMSAFTTKTAVYVLARAFAGVEFLAWMGLAMALYGVFYATMENNARRILSYHIMSQVGYMVAGIGIGTAMTLNGACAHAYAHILYKGLLFMSVGAILYSTGTAKLNQLGGLVGKLPFVMLLYMVAGLSISGMPVFNGFISKTMTIAGSFEAHQPLIGLGLELAAVGTFLSVGLKLPYFAFWGGKDETTLEVKPIPWNMYVAMGLAAALCITQGVAPETLYRYLPIATDYVPWTQWHVLQSLMLLGFTGLGFYLMRRILKPHGIRNLDFELAYIGVARAFQFLVARPAAFVDGVWSEVYRTVGLRVLMLKARCAAWFDKAGIDLVVDGVAYRTRDAAQVVTKSQTGRLQDALGLAVGLAAAVIAVIAYFAT